MNAVLAPGGSDWNEIIRFVGRITRKPDQAEDLLHSAFIRLEEYREHTKVRNEASFLIRVAANIAIDERRREQKRGEGAWSPTDLLEIPDDQPLQDEVIQTRRRLERVRLGLERFTPRTRHIFLMHRLDGKKYREIAVELGITVSAVEKHIAKAALFLSEWTDGW